LKRNPVIRPDGKLIQIVGHHGHLFVCGQGCCCGNTERGFAPVDTERYHNEWERRKLRNKVHLTHTACLGPCSLANVALLIFHGHTLWFHSLNTSALIGEVYDYIEDMVQAGCFLEPPSSLADYVFDGFLPSTMSGERVPEHSATHTASKR
jgi:cobaltochelatase CobN